MASSAGDTSSVEKLAYAAMDVLRDAGYRLDPELALGIKAIAQAEEITAALAPEAGAADFAELGGGRSRSSSHEPSRAAASRA